MVATPWLDGGGLPQSATSNVGDLPRLSRRRGGRAGSRTFWCLACCGESPNRGGERPRPSRPSLLPLLLAISGGTCVGVIPIAPLSRPPLPSFNTPDSSPRLPILRPSPPQSTTPPKDHPPLPPPPFPVCGAKATASPPRPAPSGQSRGGVWVGRRKACRPFVPIPGCRGGPTLNARG